MLEEEKLEIHINGSEPSSLLHKPNIRGSNNETIDISNKMVREYNFSLNSKTVIF